MVNIISLEDSFYHPPFPDLEELVRFPDGELKHSGIPNSTIWVFPEDHRFHPEIHGADIGCGMAAFFMEEADVLYAFLRKKNLIGRGNHFVDICSSFDTESPYPHQVLLLHTHGQNREIPQNWQEAAQFQQRATAERIRIGEQLTDVLGVNAHLFADWPHNTVEIVDGKAMYRKGVVKTRLEEPYFLPAHLGAKILVYTPNPRNSPPYDSMPHATGRVGPRGSTKVTCKQAAELRALTYIPAGISNQSLRTEHPTCYNSFEKIFGKLGSHMLTVGESQILSYVGKL